MSRELDSGWQPPPPPAMLVKPVLSWQWRRGDASSLETKFTVIIKLINTYFSLLLKAHHFVVIDHLKLWSLKRDDPDRYNPLGKSVNLLIR